MQKFKADEKAYVDVPANSVVRVDVTIIYATLESEYMAAVSLPNTKSSWIVSGKYELMQPTGYKLATTLLDL